eukprot:CAMPEP_0206325712 /NCGR_PEP_ID=MMETSP0106_2-20121207/21223_1 /ASSEMBLY_ACC=CAM_ASM_000206 /TAXON_ID=81532 /ORGANISM="Acanthoeca-like sp., Strain 10tr" /LENGTH=84 /DNA_ID=CAMNT_0053758205 /DNA_START=307 /DNA_END=557 /DNA_ORIENTATION=+
MANAESPVVKLAVDDEVGSAESTQDLKPDFDGDRGVGGMRDTDARPSLGHQHHRMRSPPEGRHLNAVRDCRPLSRRYPEADDSV